MSDAVIEVDDSLFPFVRQFGSGDLSQADWPALFARYEHIYARREKFVVFVDIRSVTKVPNPAARSQIADWTNANEDASNQFHLGSALVVSSRLVRGAMTAITWLMRPTTPQVFFTEVAGGALWCERALGKADVRIPASARTALDQLQTASA